MIKGAIVNEIKILRSLIHPHIIKIHAVFESEEFIHLVLDDAYPISFDQYSEEEISNFTHQLLNSVVFMHTRGILHRNINLESIWVVNGIDTFKLSNFEFATFCNEKSKHTLMCGNLALAAPEMKNRKSYSFELDIYNVGLLVFMILTKNFYLNQTINLYEKLIDLKLETTEEYETHKKISYDALEFIIYLTHPDPKCRPKASEAITHRWISYKTKFLSLSPGENIKQYKYMYILVRQF